jgi:hypothetical protein
LYFFAVSEQDLGLFLEARNLLKKVNLHSICKNKNIDLLLNSKCFLMSQPKDDVFFSSVRKITIASNKST